MHGYIAGILADSELLRPLLDSSTRTTLRLTNGIDIEIRSAIVQTAARRDLRCCRCR